MYVKNNKPTSESLVSHHRVNLASSRGIHFDITSCGNLEFLEILLEDQTQWILFVEERTSFKEQLENS
jgi:hypothetical protein